MIVQWNVWCVLLFSGACELLYEGPNCQIFVPCRSNPCLNNGQCVDSEQGFRCLCQSSHTGERCETPLPCAGNPCGSGGQCINSPVCNLLILFSFRMRKMFLKFQKLKLQFSQFPHGLQNLENGKKIPVTVRELWTDWKSEGILPKRLEKWKFVRKCGNHAFSLKWTKACKLSQVHNQNVVVVFSLFAGFPIV